MRMARTTCMMVVVTVAIATVTLLMRWTAVFVMLLCMDMVFANADYEAAGGTFHDVGTDDDMFWPLVMMMMMMQSNMDMRGM